MAGCLFDLPTASMTISREERAFFVARGERIATLRRARNVTQCSWPRRWSALPVVAHTLSVSLDELFGEAKPAGRSGKRGPVPHWQQRIEAVAQLTHLPMRLEPADARSRRCQHLPAPGGRPCAQGG